MISIYCVYKAIQKRNIVGPGQRSRFLVLTKRSAASRYENAYNNLTTWLRNICSSLYTAKFHCFHETKQTHNEVERFFLQLGRICFQILLRQSENFSDFCKVLSQFAFRNMIIPLYTSSSAPALKLPSISHTSFLT